MSWGRIRTAKLLATGALFCMLSKPLIAQSAPAPVSPYRVVCPEELPPGLVPTRTPTDGWATSAPQPWPVDGSGMLHGAHDGEGYLVPDSADLKKRGTRKTDIRRWTFDVPHWHETWLYCAYGPVQLARRIPVDAKECTVTVEFNGGQRGPTVFVCK